MKKGMILLIPVFLLLIGTCATDRKAADYHPVIDPADFVEGIDNPFHPLIPGTRMIYEGNTDEGRERIEFIVLDETKMVMGVTCMIVRDTVWLNGELVEDTYDWFAQDRLGNVWYMGEDSWEYEKGVKTSPSGSWEAGVGGALPGIIMHARPVIGETYRQEYYQGEAEDMAEVVSLDETVTVPYGSFSGCLKTIEWNPLDPGTSENKYYAKGIGVVLEKAVGGGEVVELIEVIRE